MNPLLVEGANVIALQTLEQISYKGLSPRAASINIKFVDPATGQTKYGTVATVLTLPVFRGTEMFYGSDVALKRTDIVTGKEIWSIPVDSRYYEFEDD